MKILLIIPKLPNDICQFLNLPTNPFGGWIDGVVKQLSTVKQLHLSLLVIENSKTPSITHHKVNYFDVYQIKDSKQETIQHFFNQHQFHVVHVIGIEHAYLKKLVNILPYEKTLFHITGIMSEIEKYYYQELKFYQNPLLYLNIMYQRFQFHKRTLIEKKILRKAHYISGRTHFDQQFIQSINPKCHYFKINETLRSEFYTAQKWTPDTCVPFEIFMAQGAYPIKGLHKVILILAKLKQTYPHIKLSIGGEDLSQVKSFITFLKGNYASKIQSLIKQHKLQENICFTGFLDAQQVIERLQKANVFLLGSAIENSPNALLEAMLLGVPCVTTRLGGTTSLIDENCALTYSYTDNNSGAVKISMLLDNLVLQESLSRHAIQKASDLCEPQKNLDDLLAAYETIKGNNI